MAFDIDMIKGVYASMGERVEKARELVGKPLTLSEKILYSSNSSFEISPLANLFFRISNGFSFFDFW